VTRSARPRPFHELSGKLHGLGKPDAAIETNDRSLAIFRGLGDRPGEGDTLRHAAEGSARAAAVFREFGIVQDEAGALYGQSRARLAMGDLAAATELCERALTLYREVNFRHGEALALYQRGRILLSVGDAAGALEALTASPGIYGEVGDQHGIACTQLELGRTRHALGDLDLARELLSRPLAFFREGAHGEVEAEAIVRLGELAQDASGPSEALDQYRRALEVLGKRKSPPNLARAHEGIARCLASTDRSAALRHAREAFELYRSMEMREAGRAEAYLAELEQTEAETNV
jgi:tetratricopeptide (TPR) repeat protein